jgi:pilus assembly protein CpaE
LYPINVILIGSSQNSVPPVRRELLNRSAHLEAEFSSVEDATDAVRRSSAEMRVLILHMDSSSDLTALGQLKTRLPGWPVIALVEGYDPRSSLGEVVIGIMRAGASEIVSLPIQAEEFNTALDRIAVQFVYSARQTKVIAVAGANGGSGATTIALNLAYEIADRHDLRCVLVDLSLRMGVVASHLNIEPAHTIIDLLRDTRRIDTNLAQQTLIKVAENFEILAGPHKLVAPVPTSSKDVALVVDTLKLVADVVVLDVPCTYDDIYFETLATASQVILIGEQKLPSIRALKMVREAIRRLSATEHLVLNKFDPKITGFEVKRLLKPLEITTLLTVARDDFGMSQSMVGACTLRLASPRSPALADIVALADTVLALEPPSRTKPMSLLGRLGRALVNS